MERLLLHLDRTHGFSKISYLMGYCIYTAASVMVQDARAGDTVASRKLETFLRALGTAGKTCQLIQRSLDIITNSLNGAEAPRLSTARPNQAMPDGMLSRHYLPAFPYRDMQMDLVDNAQRGAMHLDASSLLDCFPEQHMESSTGDWYLPR